MTPLNNPNPLNVSPFLIVTSPLPSFPSPPFGIITTIIIYLKNSSHESGLNINPTQDCNMSCYTVHNITYNYRLTSRI